MCSLEGSAQEALRSAIPFWCVCKMAEDWGQGLYTARCFEIKAKAEARSELERSGKRKEGTGNGPEEENAFCCE